MILQDNPRFDAYNIKEAVDNFVNASLVYVSPEYCFSSWFFSSVCMCNLGFSK